jgi:hypothetical protein
MMKSGLATLALLGFAALVFFGPGTSGGNTNVTYQPLLFLPLSFNLSAAGVSIQGNKTLATPVGEFSIGAHYALAPTDGRSIYVVLRDHKAGYDRVFNVRTGSESFTTVINGTTSINVTNDQVIIDVTSGNIKKITFRRASDQISEQRQPTWFQKVWHKPFARWDAGYQQSWYHYFGLSRWAYSDNTIGQWYGIGFVWFLLRLIFAVALGFIDLFLSAGLLVGQIFFVIFGPTGRDVSYGLLVIGTFLLVLFGASGALNDV